MAVVVGRWRPRGRGGAGSSGLGRAVHPAANQPHHDGAASAAGGRGGRGSGAGRRTRLRLAGAGVGVPTQAGGCYGPPIRAGGRAARARASSLGLRADGAASQPTHLPSPAQPQANAKPTPIDPSTDRPMDRILCAFTPIASLTTTPPPPTPTPPSTDGTPRPAVDLLGLCPAPHRV